MHIGLTGICLVSNVSVERRKSLAFSDSRITSSKAIHLPSGDQLILENGIPTNKRQGIRVERNFLSGPPSAETT
jgi:hypothetical protein